MDKQEKGHGDIFLFISYEGLKHRRGEEAVAEAPLLFHSNAAGQAH